MKELQKAIEQLEIEIAQNWNTTQVQFQIIKKKIRDAATSPVVLITAATAGAAVGRKIKGRKPFSLSKIIGFLSEISTAVNLVKYLKKSAT